MKKCLKVVLLFSNYGPYHLARLEASVNYFPCEQYQVCGVELSRQEKEYPWDISIALEQASVISAVNDTELEKVPVIKLVKALSKVLMQLNPDVIAISGYFRPTMLFALLWSITRRKKTILFSESTEIDAKRIWWREFVKARILRLYDAALVGGGPQQRYLTHLGMSEKSVFLGYNVVGNDSFHPQKIGRLKRPIGRRYFLSINRFVPKKNLEFLISAYDAYRKQAGSDAWDLVLCGDGELRANIEQKIKELSLSAFIHLTGFIQQNEMLPYFAHAECLVHASTHEQWGLVVNEAMAAGLPVIVSNRCGCCEDLMIEGINGFSFDPFKPDQLTELLIQMSSGTVNIKEMGQAGLTHIQKFSPDYFAQGLMQTVQYVLGES